ncbi:hypothetical protein D5F01_LYC23929 [Larimichthys crocea]|uniref:Uncharacterized protein n=2 Tax=Larimichthys crocea TaxID=215358 RepID=A0A6G0HFK7_LARCR|nr:hypothetical protein D5F01_LYC23929 [Larimichthys crocea]
MDPYSRPSFIALTVFLALVSTGLTQVQDMLYFTVWTGNGENLMSHIEAIKEQANFFHKNRLVVDIGTKEHLQKTGALENSKVVLELDTDAFAKARAKIAKVGNPTLGQHYEKFYSRLQGEYESLRGIGFYASASDILRYVAFTAYSDQAEQLVYHDADVRFERRQRQTTSLGSGADMKLVMIGFTKRKDPSIANQLSFIEPSYFYERKLREYPECVQFNTDLIFMQKSAATHSAVAIGVEQLRTIAASQRSLVEKVVGNEKTKMTLRDAIQTTHPEEARFVLPRETSQLLYRNELSHRQPEYTQAKLKAAYTTAVGLNPLDGLLQKEMDAKLEAAGPQSSHVEIGGEVYLRREEAMLLRTLLVKGDSATVKSFISDSALSPADVGAVSRQDGQRWFDVTLGALSDVPDVPVYTLEEEAALADPDAGSPASSLEGSPLSSRENSRPPSPELPQDEAGLADPDAGSPSSSRGNWRPPSPKLPQNEAGLVRPSRHELPGDVVDLSTLRFGSGREPPLVDPGTEPEAFDKSIAACMRKNRRRREASSCSLYEEENFSARQDGEFVFQEKWPVTFTREDGSLRMIVESGVNAKNVKTRVVADVPKVLVEALARKRAEMVQTARAQLEEIMSNPAVEAAVNALGSDAHLSIPSEHARGVKRMGAAYARAVTSGPKSRGVVKTWVLGTRAYGLFANIGALAYGDPVTKTFVALDLSQTVNGFMAHKLAQYAKTQDLAKVFSALADNPILNMAGIAANIFFFAQNVRNVAEGHRSPADYYWLMRSSMQMLTLVFDGLNPVMLPMVSVDALVILITQGEYATHVVRSVANKLPLSTGDVWKLGASSFFGSRSWSTYYENVASLESINGRLAQSLVEVLHTVNVAVGFPVSTVINEWHNRNGKLCVEGSVEVWPMITDSGHRASLAEADFSMESSVPLKEVYIGNSETQQLCYLMAKAKCSSPVLGWLKRFADSVAMSVGALPTDSECVFYDQSVPNATDPCGNMRKFLDDAVERKRLIPVTTEFGDPLLEPQLRAATVKAHKAKMISRPSGWMKEKRECSRFLAVDKSRPAFLETRAPDASVFKASNCSQLRQLFTRRYIGTDRGDEVLRPYVFRRAGPASREMVLYANAPMVKVRTRSLSVLEDISMYTKMLVAKADMPAVIMVGDEGVYRGATNATNIFVVSERTRALTVGGVGTDTVIISAPEKLRITMSGDARSMIKGRDTTLITVSVESIKASASSANAHLERRTDLHVGRDSHVVLEKGSQFSTLELGSNSTVTVKDHMSLCLLVAQDTTGVVVSASEHLDVDEITLVVRPQTSLVPQPAHVKRACSATERGLSLHGAVLFEKGGSAVSIDPEGVMLTCSVAADGGVYRSAYKDLSAEEGERFDLQDWRGKLEALVRAGLDEMTVTTPQGVKVAASASQQTVVVLSGNVTSVHQSFSRSAIEMDLVVDPDVTHCDVSLYGSGSSSTYCCLGSDCFHMGLRDVSRCDLIMSGVSLAGFGSTARVTVTAKGFGIAALKNRESGQYETPEGLELHSTLDSVHTVRVVLSKDVTVVFRDVLSGMERVIPAHYGEVFLKRGYDKEDLLIQGVEMMIPSW